jgi:hypothetical protein
MEPRIASMRREFQESVAQMVAEQVSSQVRARAAAMEQSTPGRIAMAVEVAVGPRMASARREFQESVAQMVAEQVSSQVRAGAAVMEESLHRRIPAAVEMAVGAAVPEAVESAVRRAVETAVSTAIESRLSAAVSAGTERLEQQLRTEVEQKDREIAELRQRLADTDTNVLELILGIGQICRQAAQKIVPPVEPEERGSAHGQSSNPAVNPDRSGGVGEVTSQFADLGSGSRERAAASRPPDEQEEGTGRDSQYDHPVPGFAQAQKPDRLWRVPLVSSVVLATGGLVLRHFL